MTTLVGCPGEADCNDIASIATKENLLKIFPLQTTYNQGDIITLKADIPSINNYYGSQLDLFGLTNDNSALLITNSLLFQNNQLTFIKGNQGSYINWFEIPYNSITGNYEIEVKIKLNRVGFYSIISADYFEFQGSDKCNRYRLDTNIEGINNLGKIEFTVQ